MKHLRIEYNGFEVFSGEVAEFTWTDSDAQVSVSGKFKKSGAGVGDLLGSVTGALAGAQKAKTEKLVSVKREELKAE